MNNLKMYDDFAKGNNIYEDNVGGGGHDAMGRGTGYYKDEVTYDKPIFFNFTAADMKTGSDDVDVNTDVYLGLKKSLQSNSGNINGSEVSIVGGASAVGSKQGYDNKALAGRRAEKLKAQLIKDIPGLASKVKFKISSVVGTADKFNSPEALKEQFVMVSISMPGKGIIKTNSEVDNTAVDTGFKVIRDRKKDIIEPNVSEIKICLRIPNYLEDEFKLALKEFKNKNLLKTIPFSVTPVKK
jgi:hypothetical protein